MNTLLDALSNETMLAIAKGLKPLSTDQVGRFSAVARVAVFGAGYVGLVTGACFAELGHDVVVRDVVPERIERLRARRGADLRAGPRGAAAAQRRAADLHARRGRGVADADFLYVAVGTPPTYSGDADLSAVWTVVDELGGSTGAPSW